MPQKFMSQWGHFHFYDCGGYGLFTLASENWKPTHRGKKVSSPRVFLADRKNRRIEPDKEDSFVTLKPVISGLGGKVDIMDVGGYIGTFCIPVALSAAACGYDVRIQCFEPGPTLDILRINIDLNGLSDRVHVNPVAISDSDAYSIYAFRSDGAIGGQVYSELNTDIQRIVPTITVDTFVGGKSERALIIKLDTQGHEPDIMANAMNVIGRKEAVWLIEYMHWSGRKKFTPTGQTFADYLLENFAVFNAMAHLERMTAASMDALLNRMQATGAIVDLLLVPNGAPYTEAVLGEIKRSRTAVAS